MTISERLERVKLMNGVDRLSLLHISDIHLWYSTGILDKLSERINALAPDLVVCTGDYYDIPRGSYNFRAFIANVAKSYTVVFIRGNHDMIYGRKISELLFDIPNCICVEDKVFTYISQKGCQYHFTSWDNRQALNKSKEGKNIVLVHNPEQIRKDVPDNIHLILAGHLHGGQFIFFKTKRGSHFPGCIIYRNCSDRKLIKNSILIVSRGLGDTFPFRWNCPKELVRIEIS